jgi:tetratricopeptide (TPR) repeat protein
MENIKNINKGLKNFSETIELIKNGWYLDAIKILKRLIKEYPNSDFIKDALYNISLCYYETHQFKKAISNLKKIIKNYPDAPITESKFHNEHGKIIAKSYYLLINCYIGIKDIKQAVNIIPLIEKYNDSYVVKDNKKITYLQLAKKALSTYLMLI